MFSNAQSEAYQLLSSIRHKKGYMKKASECNPHHLPILPVRLKSPLFLVVSDAPKWCRENLQGKDVRVIGELDGVVIDTAVIIFVVVIIIVLFFHLQKTQKNSKTCKTIIEKHKTPLK